MPQMNAFAWLILAASASVGFVARAETPKVLFKLSFDGGKADADIAGGNGKATLENQTKDPAARPEFAAGKFGLGSDALVIGEKNLGLSYELKGNVNEEKGTISFWFRRIGARPKSGGNTLYRYDVLRWDGTDGVNCWIYKWEHFVNTTLLRVEKGAGKYTMTLQGDADDGNWHCIAFTWAGSRVRGYFDGVFSCEQEQFQRPAFYRLVIGDFHDLNKGDACRRLLDEVIIHADALTSAEIKRLYREGRGPDEPDELTIPPRAKPICLDGKITPEEWNGAVEVTGFADLATGLAAETQTHARLCYDDQALYVALSSEMPKRVKDDAAMTIGMTGALRQGVTKFDASVDADDSFEVHIEPAVSNRFCRLVMNGLNVHYDYEVAGDYREGKMGAIHLDWNPPWESAALLDADSWNAEMRIPFAAFNTPAPRPGEVWGLSLVRRWVALQQDVNGWGFNQRTAQGVSYGHPTAPIRFGNADSPVVSLRNWGDLCQGFLNLEATVFNPSVKNLALKTEIITDSKELRETKDLSVESGASASIAATRKLTDFTTSQVMMTVRQADSNVVFRSGQLLTIPEELRVQTAHYPSKGLLRVEIDAGRLSDLPLDELSLSIQLKDSSGKSAIVDFKRNRMPSYQCSAELDVAKLPPASYAIHCDISRKGQSVFAREIPFEKKPFPEWFGNTLGVTDKAPKPFTPVTRNANTLGCWQRSYIYEKGLFPAQITSGGNKLLSRPMELVLITDDGRMWNSASDSKETRDPIWKKHTDFRVDYETAAIVGEIPARVECWFECDGLLWNRLILGPSKTKVKKAVLRIPFRKKWAEYVNTSDYATVKDGLLPKEGLEGAEPALWLGNGYGGLQWIVETYAGCRLRKETLPLRIIHRGTETVLQIILMDEPTAFQPPFIQEFGLIATPVRPPAPDYRRWNTYTATWLPEVSWNESSRMDWSDSKNFMFAGNPTVLKTILAGLRPPKRPEASPQHTILAPHVMVAQVSAADPNYQYWGDEWSPTAHGRKISDIYGITSTSSVSWRDFFVWNYARVYQRVRMPGVYYDCDMESEDDNPYHDGGIRVADKVRVKPSILGTRRLMQRMYVMLREREPDQTMIGLHSSGFLNLAYMAWCDWYGDGENFTSRLNKQNPDYHKLYRLDSFLAKSMGHNTGLTVRILDEQNRAYATDEEDWKRLGPQPTLHFYGMILLHDSVFWHGYGNPIGYKMVNDALIKHDFDQRYRVIGWYFDQQIVKLPENVFATFYKDDSNGRILMVLLNNNEEKLDLRLSLDWKALGIRDPDRAKADDPVFNEGATIEGGVLRVPIGAVNMRLIVIEPGLSAKS